MIDRQHSLPLVKQAKALSISRGTLYYVSRPVPAADLATQLGLGNGHYLHPHGARLRLSCRRHRLVQPEGPGLEALDDARHRLLH